MSLLLDTRVLIMWLAASQRLSPELSERISSGEETINVSAASLFEVELKRTAGKLSCPDDLQAQLSEAGFKLLPITPDHAAAAGRLPLHHADPIDRLIIGQAQCERLTILTADPRFRAYNVDLLMA
ncbi:MAG: type II toxin-antitoxin system VapC family toxin [Alphaproteobacteria bacterium]